MYARTRACVNIYTYLICIPFKIVYLFKYVKYVNLLAFYVNIFVYNVLNPLYLHCFYVSRKIILVFVMDINSIPNSLLDKFRGEFEVDPSVRALRVRESLLRSSMQYAEALLVAKIIDEMFNTFVDNRIESIRRDSKKVLFTDLPLPLKDKDEMTRRYIVCFMCSDIIESSVMDMNDILHRYDETLFIEKFDDIRAVMSMLKEKLKYLRNNSKYMDDSSWGDSCDNMYKMLLNKAGALMRHRKEVAEASEDDEDSK